MAQEQIRRPPFKTFRAGKMSVGLWRDENERDYHRDLYNSRPPREYHPNLNAPAVQSDEYVADTDWESHHISHSDNPRFFPPFPDTNPVEPPITYEQSKMMSEFFLRAMEVQYQPTDETQEFSSLAGIERMHGHSDLEDMTEGLVPRRQMFVEDDLGMHNPLGL